MKQKERDRELGRLQIEALCTVAELGGGSVARICRVMSEYRDDGGMVSTGAVQTTLKRLADMEYVVFVNGNRYTITAAGEKEFRRVMVWGARLMAADKQEEELPI